MSTSSTRATASNPLGYLLAEAGLILGMAYLLLLAGSASGVVSYDLSRFSVGGLMVVSLNWAGCLVWQTFKGKGYSALPFTGELAAVGLALAIFLGTYLLTAFTSIDPRRSLHEVWLAGVAVMLVGLVISLVKLGWPRELFIKALLIVAGVLLGLGLYSAWGWYQNWLGIHPGEWLPDLNYRLPAPNTLAIFLNLLWLPALARLLATRAWAPRILLGLWLAAAIGLLFLTSSRGGWLGAAAGGCVCLGLKWREPDTRAWLARLWQTLRRHPLILGALGLMALGISVGGGLAVLRQVMHPTHGSFWLSRQEFWEPAWQIFLQSPWVGQGPFTFGSAYARFHSVPPSLLFIHAHSVFFNLLSETGLVGTLAFSGVLVTLARALWRNRSLGSTADQAVTLGVSAALVAASVHGLFETLTAEPANTCLLAILCGVALAPPCPANGPSTPKNMGRGLAAAWPVGLALVLSLTGLYGLWLSEPLHTGVVATTATRWADARLALQEAARRDARSALVHQQLALSESVLASQGEALALTQAGVDFETAVQLDPDWALNHANLGALYRAQGNLAAARTEMETAVRLAPGAGIYFLNLGVIAEAQGEIPTASAAYSTALTLEPDWQPAYFWRVTLQRQTALAAWQAAHPADAPTLAEMEEATRTHSAYALSYINLARAYLQADRLSEAEALLRQAGLAYFSKDSHQQELEWATAELAAARQNWAAAATGGDQACQLYQAWSVFGAGTFGNASYGPFLFRREAMALDLAPQLEVIRLPDEWAARILQTGEWYEHSGDLARAQALYAEVLAAVPDNPEAQRRLQTKSPSLP